ncbi:MAG: PKD domain-containing protein [Planctomycetes bacterium]|nr:PKD domain-containing protein [Planctomycetota bacterium]
MRAQRYSVLTSALLILFLARTAQTATHTAASCSLADVQAKVAAASDGDTILIPNGSATWTGGIATTKQIRIRAQQYTPTAGGQTARGVVLTNNSPQPLFSFTSGNSHHCGLAGIKFVEGSQKTNFIRIEGSGSKPPLINDCWFDLDERFGNNPDVSALACMALGGVIWNCRFDTPGVDFQGFPGSQGGSIVIYSPRAWNTASTMGALDTQGNINLYFEDCSFFNSSGCPDADDRARVVFRHCQFDGTGGLTHGFTSTWGGRHFEYYDCTFSQTTPERNLSRYFWCRAGTGIFTDCVVNNNVSPSAFGNSTLINIGDNTNPTGYPQPRQPGWGHDGTQSVIDPIYLWNNSGARAYTWSVWDHWANNVKLNREIYVNSGPKPGYSKYVYPHPFRSADGSGGTPPALPEGNTGIAAQFPGDANIQSHANVVFADDFESYTSATQLTSKWNESYHQANTGIEAQAAHVFAGQKALRFSVPVQTGETSNTALKYLNPKLDVLFVRCYTKFDSGFLTYGSSHNGIGIQANYSGPGIPANGTNKFYVGLENSGPSSEPAPGMSHLYVYHPGQRDIWGDHFYPDGRVVPFDYLPGDYGPHFIPRPNFTPQRDRWYCMELMVKANTPGQRDGRIAYWIDGKLAADFLNLRLRDVDTRKIDKFFIGLHINGATTRVNTKWYDNVVAATSYIGPLSSGTVPPPTNAAPSVDAGPNRTITLPNSATLDGTVSDDGKPSGTLTVSWSKASGPGTVTFANAAAVDTTASFGAAGTYSLRLTASDGALSASDTMSVTVQPAPNRSPTIVSDPSAAPNPAQVGQSVSFSILASDPDGDALAYAWVFGDGDNGSGASTSHAYALAGAFTAACTITDGRGGTLSRTVLVTVQAPTTTDAPIERLRASGRLNFAHAGRDTCQVSGYVEWPAGRPLAGAAVSLDVGGVRLAGTLDARGRLDSGSQSLRVTAPRRGGPARFVAALRAGDFAPFWKDEGLSNTDATRMPCVLRVRLELAELAFSAETAVLYSARAGKSGRFR